MSIILRKVIAVVAAALVVAFALTAIVPAAAQPYPDDIGTGGTPGGTPGGSRRQIVEGVAAVVGDKIILISDVTQRAQLAAVRAGLRSIEPGLLSESLNSLIAEKLELVRAEQDSIEVPAEVIDEQVETRLAGIIKETGSEAATERAFGKSMAEIRRQVREVVTDQLRIQVARQRKFSDIKVTGRDVSEFYRLYRDSLENIEIPRQYEIAHIYMAAEPTAQAAEKAMTLAQSIADSIRAGGDFAAFARRYSVDVNSARNGGDLGTFAKGRLDADFERAVAKLELNQISDPVRTQFGVHVIQLTDRRGDSIRTRHILLPLIPGDEERRALVDSLSALRKRALAGESFAELALAYSDDEVTKYRGGVFGKLVPGSIPQELRWIVDSLTVGEISEPRPLAFSPTESGYHIATIIRDIPPHKLDPEEDRALLEVEAKGWKADEEYVKWLAELREEIYWDVKFDFATMGEPGR